MLTLAKLILSSVSGFLLGVAVLFLALVAAIGFAFATGGEVFLPGIFKAWFTTENDMPAMNFEPNFVGMLVTVLVITGVYVWSAFAIGRRLSARRGADA